MSGCDEADALAGGFAPTGEMLENLSETEHLRWCGFHYAMGWSPMDESTLRARGAEYAARLNAGLDADIRITKDMKARKHACLIPWEKLDWLSELEYQLTGRQVDYKQIDRNNVLALPELLRRGEEGAL